MHHVSWPSPALVVAVIALIVAVGGTSYAALKLPAKSVGTVQIKDKAVTKAKVATDTLTGAQIKESTLAAVPAGGIDGLTFKSVTVSIPAGMGGPVPLKCASGLNAIAGGAELPHEPGSFLNDTHPVPPDAWESVVANQTSSDVTVKLWVVCAKGGPGSGAVNAARVVHPNFHSLAH